MEGPIVLLIGTTTGLRFPYIVIKTCKTNIKAPILVCGVLHRSKIVAKDVIGMCLILFYTDTTNEVWNYKFKNAELLGENKCVHRLTRIKYAHEFITNPFT